MNAAEYQQAVIDLTTKAMQSQDVRPADILATLETTKHSIMHLLSAKQAAPKIFTPTFVPPTDVKGR